jgi:hypothetical protein
MNSREFDGLLDDLMRQALYPFAEAEPSLRVWRRVLRAVRLLRAECAPSADFLALIGLPSLTGLVATVSRWTGFLAWMKESEATYAPLYANRAYHADPTGRYSPSLFWDVTLRQMFDLRLAS